MQLPPRKILAIKLRSLGDTILMTAPLQALRTAYPEAEIHVAVTSTWAPLLEGHPAIDRIWLYQRHERTAARAKAIARLALILRNKHFDSAVNFHASPSSATLAFATGARTRSIHFHGHKNKNRYSTVLVPGKGTLKPNIERDMDTIRALGLLIPEGKLPQLHLKETELQAATERLKQHGLKTPVLAIGLGSSRPTKSWPIERFAALAIAWNQRTGGSVLALAGPGEESLSHHFLKSCDDALGATYSDLPERASARAQIACEVGIPLRMLAALLQVSDVFVGNDSGPKHIAVAVNTPTITLFGPEHPFEWHPYPSDLHPYLFVEGLACRKDAQPGMPPWCGLNACEIEEHKCMRQIGVEEVFTQCQHQWQRIKSK